MNVEVELLTSFLNAIGEGSVPCASQAGCSCAGSVHHGRFPSNDCLAAKKIGAEHQPFSCGRGLDSFSAEWDRIALGTAARPVKLQGLSSTVVHSSLPDAISEGFFSSF